MHPLVLCRAMLIRMEATSINQVDWRFQKGVAWPVMPRKFPFISGEPWP
jgi:chloroplastic oxoene reductase